MVGKNLCLHPISESYSLITPNRKELDLLNYFETENYLLSHKPDFVIHCAGKVGGPSKFIEPIRIFKCKYSYGYKPNSRL